MDDILREVITRRGLGTEDEDTRCHVDLRIGDDLAVEADDVQQIEMLTLVLMQTLDLHIEQRIRADADAAGVLNDLGECHLMPAFDLMEALAE